MNGELKLGKGYLANSSTAETVPLKCLHEQFQMCQCVDEGITHRRKQTRQTDRQTNGQTDNQTDLKVLLTINVLPFCGIGEDSGDRPYDIVPRLATCSPIIVNNRFSLSVQKG